MFTSKITFVALAILWVTFAQGQLMSSSLNIPTPEVASLGKYGDIPVGYYTGVPNIEIPIASLPNDEIPITVKLNYHSSGIKVNEIASRVGLGWSLNVGGMVNRSMRGIPDDTPSVGYLYTNDNPSKVLNNAGNEGIVLDILDNTSRGLNDLESDIYYFNLPGGISGKFFFNEDGKIILSPHSNISILPIKNGSIIKGWKIIANEGTTFYLGISRDGLKESIERSNPSSVTSLSGGGFSLPETGTYTANFISTWQLKEIETISGELISFEYESQMVEFWNFLNQRKYFVPSSPSECINHNPTTFGWNREATLKLKKITSSTGLVIFDYDLSRQDLIGDYALTAVRVFNIYNELVDQHNLEYDYFISTTHLYNGIIGNLDQRRKRLYLKKVVQTKNSEKNREYKLIYNTNYILPDRLSTAQDLWGYYNGRQNTVYYPSIKYSFENGRVVQFSGANRKVQENYAQACILKQIVYPTGGSTEYEFESNKVSNQGNTFFASTELEEQVLFSYDTNSMSGNEVTLSIPILNPSEYIGALSWSVSFTNPCNNPNGFECPRAEIYYDGQINPIYETNGNSDQYLFDVPGSPSNLNVKIFNYSEDFEGIRNDIVFNILGYKLPLQMENAALSGGLRVKSIINKDTDGKILSKKRFEYAKFQEPSISSGSALFPPTFVYLNKPVCVDQNNLVLAHEINANSIFPLFNGTPYSTGYTNVTEYLEDDENLGKNEYSFTFNYDGGGIISNIYAPENYPNTPLHDLSYRRGLLSQKTIFKKNNGIFDTIQKITKKYIGMDNYDISSKNISSENISSLYYPYQVYTNYSGPIFEIQEAIQEYYPSAIINRVTDYSYEPYPGRTFPLKKQTRDSRGNAIESRFYFADDVLNVNSLGVVTLSESEYNAYDEFKWIKSNGQPGKHRINIPIQKLTIVKDINGLVLSETTSRIIYKDYGNGAILPYKSQSLKGGHSESNNFNNEIIFKTYDDYGNPIELELSNGSITSYLWGYNKNYVIAKIEGVSYEEIRVALNLASITDVKNLDEEDFSLINSLRTSLEKAMISTFIYNPMVGVTSITDPKGITTNYEYDHFNRLSAIKDQNGNIISEKQFNYYSN